MATIKQLLQTVILIAVIFLPLSGFAQLESYTFSEVDSLQKLSPKNVVIFIHTDWCKYCLAMKNSTFKDEKIIALLNEDFWFAKLMAESKEDIVFNGYTFKYKPTGSNTGIHELAEQLGTVDGKVSYPTLCILNPDYEIIFQYNQFIKSIDLETILIRLK